ncbi:hypothetical protein ACHQM5_000034 [Ranunculus cassubicifolius]
MCRSPDGGFLVQRDRLKLRAFYMKLSITGTRKPLPETITLHYLPRLSGSPLEIEETKIRSESDAFVILHRVRSSEKTSREAIYASRERVRVGEAVRFEIFVKEEKILKGIFRKDEEEDWRLDCQCALEKDAKSHEISEAEISVVPEGHVAIVERVDMRRRKKCWGNGLDEIPEERDEEMDVCDCCCGESESESDGDECLEESKEEDGMEMEGVKWAVDVGIWVMCLGVGYFVTKASSKRLSKRVGLL